jgi:hypothetical protein
MKWQVISGWMEHVDMPLDLYEAYLCGAILNPCIPNTRSIIETLVILFSKLQQGPTTEPSANNTRY